MYIVTGSINETIDLRLQSRAEQQDRGNDDNVRDGPGTQPYEGEFVREPQIEGEQDEGYDPGRHNAHRK